MKDKIIIFDTTLRDGEQSPGASMNADEKMLVAKGLEKLGVDVMEVGFAAASKGDFEAIYNISKQIKNATVCSLSRALESDIMATYEAVKSAPKHRIHTFIATSPIHMKYKLNMEPDRVYENAMKAVKFARNLCDDIEFSCEDASRTEFDFLCKMIEGAISNGATTINITDTVGYALPSLYGKLIKDLINIIPNSDKAVFSVHCHNDLGLSVSNSIAGIENGARQVECTINGIGERAGNTSLEEVVMTLKTRNDIYNNFETSIDTTQIANCSKLVSQISGFMIQPNKAIVGANAFAHESGIHQHGMINNPETYEIMKPEDIGLVKSKLVLGKHSGKHAFINKLNELAITDLSNEQIENFFVKFKQLADKKREIFDNDIKSLFDDTENEMKDKINIKNLNVSSKNQIYTVNLELVVDNEEFKSIASGNGSIDATYKAIEKIIKSNCALKLYSVNAITKGTEAQGEVDVIIEFMQIEYRGKGIDTDIILASAKAYINALNSACADGVNIIHCEKQDNFA